MSAQVPRLAKAKANVAYMGPELGPFKCGHCTYFQSPSQCAKVAGSIDPNACCNLYEMGPQRGTIDMLRRATA